MTPLSTLWFCSRMTTLDAKLLSLLTSPFSTWNEHVSKNWTLFWFLNLKCCYLLTFRKRDKNTGKCRQWFWSQNQKVWFFSPSNQIAMYCFDFTNTAEKFHEKMSNVNFSVKSRNKISGRIFTRNPWSEIQPHCENWDLFTFQFVTWTFLAKMVKNIWKMPPKNFY